MMKPRFFKSQAEFRAWLEKRGAAEKELWIGYYKKTSGKGGLVYAQALDEALCWGWIDGVVKRIDADSYMQRWTPRLPSSNWSLKNTKRVGELTKLGLMAEPGLKAFRERKEKKSGVYLYERKPLPLSSEYERRFKANKRAWTFFEALPPGNYIVYSGRFDSKAEASAALPKLKNQWPGSRASQLSTTTSPSTNRRARPTAVRLNRWAPERRGRNCVT